MQIEHQDFKSKYDLKEKNYQDLTNQIESLIETRIQNLEDQVEKLEQELIEKSGKM